MELLYPTYNWIKGAQLTPLKPMFPSVGLLFSTSDFDDAPGEREAIECLTVGETQLARWRPIAWTVGCLIAFDDEIACDFFLEHLIRWLREYHGTQKWRFGR